MKTLQEYGATDIAVVIAEYVLECRILQELTVGQTERIQELTFENYAIRRENAFLKNQQFDEVPPLGFSEPRS